MGKMNIQEKLNVIQIKLNAPKNSFNKFGGYYYRSCEDILSSIKDLLKETKTTLTINDELVLIGERYYVKATATLHDCESNESISNNAYARESEDKKGMDTSQITGATSSYARKYALNGLLCIDDTKDSDTEEYTKQQNKTSTHLATEKQVEILTEHWKKGKQNEIKQVLANAKVTKLNELTLQQASDLIKKLS